MCGLSCSRYMELRSPSPRPSPPGRGRAVRCVKNISESPLQSPLSLLFCQKPDNNLWQPNYLMADDDSPSPGGEGRGEGGRFTHFPPTRAFASLRRRLP
jgi:hypothetical protein